MNHLNRRTFLEFLGIGAASVLAGGCFPSNKEKQTERAILKSLSPSAADQLELAEGLHYEVLVKWDDPISANARFGFNNDYLAFLPLDNNNPDEGLLWVNHEYVDPMFVSGYFEKNSANKTQDQVDKEMQAVGGSILHVKKTNGRWRVVKNDALNRRLDGFTEIPFNWPEPIAGSLSAIGTLANCAGGMTPWGTILTCEENYDLFYGERDFATGNRTIPEKDYGWYRFYDYPPEHYGWVVEVNPKTGEAKKHVALGRCAHECATVKQLRNGRIVVYTGDDSNDECLYKFISSQPGSLSEGTLYVANTAQGKWISLKYEDQPVLQQHFKNQTEVLIRLREAAKLVGATPLDRPEDIEISPVNGEVLVALTNNIPKGNYVGSILKITEKDGRHDALEFSAETYLTGGEETGFASPDNMAFDGDGNLWFTCDVSGSSMNNPEVPEYLPYKNNSLFVVPKDGPQKGEVIRMANAPVNAEFTGPFFAPDGKTLFLSVQHPGEYSDHVEQPKSHWPEGGGAMPRPSVVVIYGWS
ncbi:MAG: DUF839 domain-containing protein [Lewinellaceae bacterium]|nr:DUF839 domain-containing protein [Lewinellaceae bacterium]